MPGKCPLVENVMTLTLNNSLYEVHSVFPMLRRNLGFHVEP